ncbi:MAG: prepilin-type cleavage/methylation domain-containing protein [Aphanocapsa sp. GSE-SYN-MK-11-07L]|jgi:type II secretory pathway pseudopilin PulG|nr:prepilin-type cleavage/methylation domain-containing protein [Aphanocapsa sp. GSE-SYN-MK-11-07L]
MKRYRVNASNYRHRQRSRLGFTLPELLIATSISFLVVALAFSALIMISNLNKQSQIKIERRIELSRAFDFMTQEIQAARRINRTVTAVADGGSTTLQDVITSSGLNLANLGNYGTIALYLEIPMTASPSCAFPKDYDQVVYDIRPNPSSWLGPRIVSRYGRVPKIDGTINPCSSPIASDVLVDSMSATGPTPACVAPGVLSGSGGFYACVTQGLVDLYLRSALSNLTSETRNLASKAFSRLANISAPSLSATRTGNQIALTWGWGNPSISTFKLVRSVAGGPPTEIYSGSNLNFTDTLTGSKGDQNCYKVTAIAADTSADSNQVCEALP